MPKGGKSWKIAHTGLMDSVHPYSFTYIIIWDLGHDESWIRDMSEVTDTEELQP